MDAMRGLDEMQEPLFTTVKLEDFVPADHPADQFDCWSTKR